MDSFYCSSPEISDSASLLLLFYDLEIFADEETKNDEFECKRRFSCREFLIRTILFGHNDKKILY